MTSSSPLRSCIHRRPGFQFVAIRQYIRVAVSFRVYGTIERACGRGRLFHYSFLSTSVYGTLLTLPLPLLSSCDSL
jgi:hypothetical protein